MTTTDTDPLTTPTPTGAPMTTLTTLAKSIFNANAAKGFWDRERPLTETTMLIITELAEAVEEERAGRAGVWYNDGEGDWHADTVHVAADGLVYDEERHLEHPLKPEGIDVELIDALIRLLDLLGSRDVDVDELLRQKLAFNASRPARHGKAY